MILTIQNLAKLTKEKDNIPCEGCEKTYCHEHDMKAHNGGKHEENISCDLCDKVFSNLNDLQHHIGAKQKGKDECEYWDNISSAEDELQCHNKDAHEEVFFIHHSEDISEEEIELDSEMWKVLLSERDEKELTETEKKEIVKLRVNLSCTIDPI